MLSKLPRGIDDSLISGVDKHGMKKNLLKLARRGNPEIVQQIHECSQSNLGAIVQPAWLQLFTIMMKLKPENQPPCKGMAFASGTSLVSHLHHCVEEGQDVDQRPEGCVWALCQHLLCDLAVACPHVELQPIGRFSHHL